MNNTIKTTLTILLILLGVSGCSTDKNPTLSSDAESQKKAISTKTPPANGMGSLIAYYPHSGSLLQGFSWFQPFIINGKNAGNIPPKKHIVCHLTPGIYLVSTTFGGFGLPNNLRHQAKRKFTVIAGKTTYVQFNVSSGAYKSVQIVSGSQALASSTQAADECSLRP